MDTVELNPKPKSLTPCVSLLSLCLPCAPAATCQPRACRQRPAATPRAPHRPRAPARVLRCSLPFHSGPDACCSGIGRWISPAGKQTGDLESSALHARSPPLAGQIDRSPSGSRLRSLLYFRLSSCMLKYNSGCILEV